MRSRLNYITCPYAKMVPLYPCNTLSTTLEAHVLYICFCSTEGPKTASNVKVLVDSWSEDFG
jgi:hypothetical protein